MDAQKDDAVDGRLHGLVKLARAQIRIMQSDVLGQLRRPDIAAQLKGRSDIVLEVDRGLFRLNEELSKASDPKAVIGRTGTLFHPDGVFVNDLFVGFCIARDVVHIPTQSLEEGVNKLSSHLRLVVLARLVVLLTAFEPLNQLCDLLGCRQAFCLLIFRSPASFSVSAKRIV